MKKGKEKQDIFLKRRDNIGYFGIEHSTLDFLGEAWNNLPYDATVEERLIFMEITERILKAYYYMKQYSKEDTHKN